MAVSEGPISPDDQVPGSLPQPAFQPGGVNINGRTFEDSSVWWWNNGIWGEAGYAIPNDGGKPRTGNEQCWFIHNFVGAELFNLMHKPDVKFSRPFNVQWLQALNKMLTLGLKRIGDVTIGWTDKRTGDADHGINTPQDFMVYPVPYFGRRIRQLDARKWCGWILHALAEAMQHSDNDYDDDITDFFAFKMQEDLRRVQRDMAMKYLGFTRDQVEAADFTVPATAFTDYDPGALYTEREMVEERMPERWWPNSDDLTPINGVPASVARMWAARWPEFGLPGDFGAHEAAWPGGGTASNVVQPPARADGQVGNFVANPAA